MIFWYRVWEMLKTLFFISAVIGLLDICAHTLVGVCLNPLTYAAKKFSSTLEHGNGR